MSITWPSKTQLRAAILAIWTGERPDADSSKYSDLWLFSRITAVLVYRLHRTIQRSLDAVFPTTSFESYLDSWLSWVGLEDGQGGFGRILPHISAATDGITCTATGGGPGVAANAWQNKELTDTAGKTYTITEAHGAVGAGSSVDLDIQSVDTGYDTNLESGTVLTFSSPPAGSDSTATLAKDLIGGKDLETDSAGRARLLARLRNPPASGNVASWVATIEAVSQGNLRAFVWPGRENYPYPYGTTDYAALWLNQSGSDRHIASTDDIYDEIATAVEEYMPIYSWYNSRQLTMTAVAADVDLTITLGSGATESQKCDWDAESIKTTVAGTTYASLLIDATANVCSPTVTNGLEVGHRVVIDGYEAEVATVNVGDASKFTVTDWPDGWPTGAAAMNGLYICSGGGFVGYKTDYANEIDGTGCIEAIRAHIDARGPNDAERGAVTDVEGWSSGIKIQSLESACFVVGGGVIEAVAVATPATDLAHAAETTATVKIYDPGEIRVWQVYA